jgi:AraC-like DNA-binding protein
MSMLTFKLPPFPTFIKGGEATFHIGKKHFKRTFSVFDMLYVKKGELFITEEGVPYSVSAGQYIILAPHFEHVGHQACTEETEYVWLHFQVEGGYELKPSIPVDWSTIFVQDSSFTHPVRFNFHLPRFGQLKQHRLIEAVLKRLVSMNEWQSPEQKLRQQIIFDEFILLLQREAFSIPSSAEQVTEKVLAFIHENYRKTIRMQDMAKALLFHPDYLTRCMQQMIGMSPTQYLNQYRVSVAKQLLATSNDTMGSISNSVGISDPAYFSKLFKKTEGMSPIQYRRVVSRDDFIV